VIFQKKKRGVVSPTKSLGVQNVSRRNFWKNLMGFAGSTSVEIAREANLRATLAENDQKLYDSEKPKSQTTSVQVTAERYSRPSVSRRS
jgi:hypothetical protein